ncbi:hypothetical protein FACS189472_17930 [Alphaproteobacteria bacterium]|nr:hypothetical protein FACS189472_17930 [Alphaproteobacteria bacterium]
MCMERRLRWVAAEAGEQEGSIVSAHRLILSFDCRHRSVDRLDGVLSCEGK